MKYIAVFLLFAISGSRAPAPALAMSCEILTGSYHLSNGQDWQLVLDPGPPRTRSYTFTLITRSGLQNPQVRKFRLKECTIINESEKCPIIGREESITFTGCADDVCSTSGTHYQRIRFITESGFRLTGSYLCSN